MGIIKDILEVGPKAIEMVEAWVTDPIEAMRRSITVSEGFTLVIAALFISFFTFIVTGLVYFATLFPETFRKQAGGDVNEKVSALSTLAGAQLVTAFCSIVIVALLITVGARLAGSAPRTGLFAKILVIFSVEALAGVPMAVLIFCENTTLQHYMLGVLGALRLIEICLLIVPLRVAGGLRGFRLAFAWGVGVPLPTTMLIYVLSIMNWVMLGPNLVQGWD